MNSPSIDTPIARSLTRSTSGRALFPEQVFNSGPDSHERAGGCKPMFTSDLENADFATCNQENGATSDLV